MFKIMGLHLLHLNVNILLTKNNGLKHMVKLSNAAAIMITKMKLDN